MKGDKGDAGPPGMPGGPLDGGVQYVPMPGPPGPPGPKGEPAEERGKSPKKQTDFYSDLMNCVMQGMAYNIHTYVRNTYNKGIIIMDYGEL